MTQNNDMTFSKTEGTQAELHEVLSKKRFFFITRVAEGLVYGSKDKLKILMKLIVPGEQAKGVNVKISETMTMTRTAGTPDQYKLEIMN